MEPRVEGKKSTEFFSVFKEMEDEDKERIVLTAKKLLSAQKMLKDETEIYEAEENLF